MNKIVKRIIFYIFGMVVISYGVAFMFKAGYGLCSIDASSLSLKYLFDKLTIGEATIIINVLLVVISELIKPSLAR